LTAWGGWGSTLARGALSQAVLVPAGRSDRAVIDKRDFTAKDAASITR